MVIRNVTVNNCTPETIVIGRRGTFETMQVVFDLTYLIENYGDGIAVLALKRSQDTSAYPAVEAQDGNTLTWVVREVDTYYVGAGECQLMWYVDGGLAKTIIYPLVVMRDILSTSEEAPDAYQEWVDDLTALGAETLQNAQDAAQSASDAESAKDEAVTAKEAAVEAASMLQNVSATATTLDPNQPATASYNDGVFSFGIPKGDKGDKMTYADLTEADKLDLIQGPIAEAQADAEQAIEDKGEEVLESIPEDYTETVNAIDDITSIGEYLDLSTVEMTVGSYLKPSGEIGQNDAFMLSDFIELPEGVNTITVNRDVYTSNGQKYPQSYMVFWYDAEKVYKETGVSTFSDNLLTSSPSNWFGYKYVRINFSRYKVHNFVKFGYYYDLKYKTHLLAGDLNDVTDPGVYLIPSIANVASKPDMQNTLAFLTVNLSPFNGHESQVLATRYGQYTRTKINGVWTDWAHPDDGLLYSYTGMFTTTETLQTEFTMSPNTSYVIKFYGDRTNIVNVYGIGNSNNYKVVPVWNEEVLFTNDGTARKLAFYNPRGQLDSVNVKVYKTDSVALKAEAVPRVYRVTKSTTGDYTSLSKCLIDLKDDHSPKVIEVWEGDYDIYAEYVELYNAGLLEIYTGNNPALDYFPYCVWVPENTHIIGKGIVRLKWMPDPTVDDITSVQCQCISPLNVAATATIENVEVHCKNGRYCLHNDGLGKAEFTGAVQKYINIRFYKYANDVVDGVSYGWNHTTGFGIDRAMHHIYENCAFYNSATGRAFYGHSRGTVGGVTLTEAMCSDITLTNCILESNCGATGVFCKLGNSPNQNLHIPVSFDNCTFGEGWMLLANESTSAQTEYPNAFDLTFNNCGEFNLQINDTNNRYPPKRYDNLLQEIDNMKTDNGIYEKLTNAGEYVISADDLESGQWSWSRKDDNAARARTKFLIPVYAGMSIAYQNTTFDTYFGVIPTPTSMEYYPGLSGWKTDSSGVFNITADGYLTFVIRNHADTTATVDPADFDSVVTIRTAQKNAIGAKQDATSYVTLSGTIVTQTGADNTMYLCGELAELTFNTPAVGQTAIRFRSGTTPTVASFPNVTEWMGGFDPDDLEASVLYEINVLYGVGVAQWT